MIMNESLLTPILFTIFLMIGLFTMFYKKPTYKKKDLTVVNSLTNVTSVITIEQDVEEQLIQALYNCNIAVIDEQITER